jgi:hypothetical protein
MKRIGYHPHVHPAQPWCVFDTNLPEPVDVSRLPKIALFATRQQARDAHPDAVVDPDFEWECQMVVVRVFATAESAAAHVHALVVEADTFSLALSDDLSLGGQADSGGAALAVVTDAVLARGFAPSGFQERAGYRVYDYKRM